MEWRNVFLHGFISSTTLLSMEGAVWNAAIYTVKLSSSKLQTAIVPFGLTDFSAWISKYVTRGYVWNSGYPDLNLTISSCISVCTVFIRLTALSAY